MANRPCLLCTSRTCVSWVSTKCPYHNWTNKRWRKVEVSISEASTSHGVQTRFAGRCGTFQGGQFTSIPRLNYLVRLLVPREPQAPVPHRERCRPVPVQHPSRAASL